MFTAKGFTKEQLAEVSKVLREQGAVKRPIKVKMREEIYLTFKEKFAIIEEREEEEIKNLKKLGIFGVFSGLPIEVDNTLTKPYEIEYE